MDISKSEFYEAYADLFDYAGLLLEKGSISVQGAQKKTLEVHVALMYLARAIRLMASIRYLCSIGYGAEALVLLRSLLNLYINIKWLTKDNANERMRRYADFEMVNKFVFVNSISKSGQFDEKWNAECEKLKEAVEPVLEKYQLRRKVDNLHKWSGKSIRAMADEVSLTSDYVMLYGHLSEVEHTGPAMVEKYLESDDEQTVLKVGPSGEDIHLAMLSTIEYFLGVIDCVSCVVAVEWDNESSDLKTFQDLQKKYAKHQESED